MKKRIFWRLTMMLAVCFACSLAVPAFAANVQEAQACEQKAAEEYENEDYMYAAIDYEWAAEIYIEIGMPTEAKAAYEKLGYVFTALEEYEAASYSYDMAKNCGNHRIGEVVIKQT